jgi:predicted Zn finger-like uncharacterized protein
MLIVCPSCASRYEIDPEKLGTGGRKVRCRGCSFQWFAHGEGVPDGKTPEQPDNVANVVQPSAMAAEETSAPAMHPEQSAEDFVEQEWSRTGEIDQAVSEVISEQARISGAEADNGAPGVVDTSAVEQSLGRAGVNSAAPSTRGRPVKAPRKKLSLRLNWPLPKRVSSGLSRSVFSPGGIVIGGIAILGLMIVQRHAVVSRVPQMAGVFRAIGLPVNLQGLEFERVVTELVEDAQGRFLIVQGEIRNIARGTLAVPPIEIIIQDTTVKSLYTWTAEASRPTIIQGDSIPFRTRLASPPQTGSNVILRFAADRKTVQN